MAHSELYNFEIQRQSREDWCWVAVAASVSAHYNNPTPWTQCQLAGQVKGKNCCPASAAYGECAAPGDAERALDVAKVWANRTEANISFDDCLREVAAKRLIVVRRGDKKTSVKHTIVIWNAYRDAGQNNREIIWWGDPNGGYKDCHLAFSKFTDQSDGQEWTHTYFTRDDFPPKAMPPQVPSEEVPPNIQRYANRLVTPAQRPPRARSLGELLPTVPTHRVFIATAADLLESRTDRLAFYGWRSLYRDSSGELTAVIAEEAPPDGADFVESRRGQQVDSFAALFEGSVPAGTPQMLRVPSIELEAARFESEEGVIYIPLAPAPAGLTAGERYQPDAFFEIMKSILQERDKLYRDHGFPSVP